MARISEPESSSQSVMVRPDQRVSTVIVPDRYRWPRGSPLRSAGATVKCPATAPPSRSANTADESGFGSHSQVIRELGATRATVFRLDSIECRSIGMARSPYSQFRLVSSTSARTRTASSGLSTRYPAAVSPWPILTPTSGPCSWMKAFSSVTSSPRNSTALEDICMRSASMAVPLWVAITDSSITCLPLVTCTSGHAAGPDRTASATESATSGAALRRCTAMLAGLRSSRTPSALRVEPHQLVFQPLAQRDRLRREPLDEPDVELGAVAADQMYLAGQAGQGG